MSLNSLWKGVLTTTLGLFVWGFGFTEKMLSADTPSERSPLIKIGGTEPSPLADFMQSIGPVLVAGGAVWTWYLSRKAEKDQYERDKATSDRDAKRNADEADRMSQFRLEVARAMARMEIIHAEAMAATLPNPNPDPAPKTEESKP